MIGAFTLLLVLTVTLDFNHITTYLFGFALASLFASIMIYAARVLHEQTPDVQEPKAITYIADISYGIYLFHWPFYIIFSQLMSHILAVILTVFFSILFATVSYYIVEPLVQGRKPNLLGLEIDCSPYYKWIVGGSLALALLTLGTCMIAPKVGKFEKQLLVSSLQQAQSNMERTHTLAAGDANALSDVGIIGDSVALRSSAAFSKIMPQAQLDAAVSRNFKEAFDLFNNQIKSKSLSKTVVLAVGVNSLDNYSQAVQSFIEALPKGHRLVLVSPYNAKMPVRLQKLETMVLNCPKNTSMSLLQTGIKLLLNIQIFGMAVTVFIIVKIVKEQNYMSPQSRLLLRSQLKNQLNKVKKCLRDKSDPLCSGFSCEQMMMVK